MSDDNRARPVTFDIPLGSIPDMLCGGARDGVSNYDGKKLFRPEYFSVEASGDQMTELRLWGREVTKDGSLGARHLDYLFKWSQPSAE
jgi:hypothetical protein